MKKQEYAKFIYSELDKLYPNAHCELDHKNAFELLIATILSAQCTDVRVNMVTPHLFAKFPNPKALASAKAPEVEKIIHSTGFYKNKAKNIINCAIELRDKYNSEVPPVLDHLVNLPGVGKKTANVILGNAFNIASGVVVDTHVMRISQLLKLTKNRTPEKIEQDLMKLFAKENWIKLSHLFIFLGRNICKARTPQCEVCPLKAKCPSAK